MSIGLKAEKSHEAGRVDVSGAGNKAPIFLVLLGITACALLSVLNLMSNMGAGAENLWRTVLVMSLLMLGFVGYLAVKGGRR